MKEWLARRFGRVTSSGHYIPEIDGLRLVAMLAVLGHHVFAIYLEQTHRLGTERLPRDWAAISARSPLVSWGLHLALGVPLFCAISGFVLSLPFAANCLAGAPRPSRKIYFLRRLVRLEPPYFLNLIFLFGAIVAPWGAGDPAGYFRSYFHAFAPHLMASLGYLHGAIYGEASWINGVAWTLEIEVQFYLLLPLLAELFRIRPAMLRRAILVCLVLGSGMFAQYWVRPNGGPRLNLSLAIQLQFFLAGMLLADLYLEPPGRVARGSPAGDAIAVASLAAFVYVVHWRGQLEWTEPVWAMGIYFGVLFGRWAGAPFRLRLVTLLGGMSYTVYLYHFYIVGKLMPLTVGLLPPKHALWFDAGMQFAAMLLPVFAISAMLFVTTERPFMVMSKGLSRR
jgi:peptidoglycan/LPS O-acetylase OafA/YrhL